ncbi:MAG: hypothetical protein ABJA02_13110 [Acidobacteriota bacterium]
MKIKLVVLFALTLALTSVGMAQTKKTVALDAIVKDLYAAQKTSRGPFFQKKSRVLVDKYFTGELADLIWKDAVSVKKGEVGALDFDPLFYAQDTQITKFVIHKADTNNMVRVTFVNMGHPEEINFGFVRKNTSSNVYKIDSIVYSDAEDLASILSYSVNDDGKPAEKIALDGDYTIGGVKCNVETVKSGYWARVKCDDQENFQIIDTESLTFGTFNPNEKGRRGKFVLAQDGSINKYVDASGKEIEVTRSK